MVTILQKILLFIALTVFLGTVVYAEENSISQVSKIEEKYDYHNMVEKQKPTTQEDTEYTQASADRMKIIEYQREQRMMEYKKEELSMRYQEDQRRLLAKANILNVQIVATLYAFSLIIIIILMWRTDHQAKDIVTIVGLVSVIFATLLLVLMIANTETMTAPIGIFGAIAGYLFGTVQKKEAPKEEPKKEDSKE